MDLEERLEELSKETVQLVDSGLKDQDAACKACVLRINDKYYCEKISVITNGEVSSCNAYGKQHWAIQGGNYNIY